MGLKQYILNEMYVFKEYDVLWRIKKNLFRLSLLA